MNTVLVVSNVVLWFAVLFVGFLLVGTLRSVGLLSWRLQHLEMTTPRRLGRDGITVGKQAPDFKLPSAAGGEVSLRDFAGRKVLLVFTQSGCRPCHEIAPEVNRLHNRGEHQVVVINHGDFGDTRAWAAASGLRFPVLVQEKLDISKRYQVFATPFAFLIDEQGKVTSKGLVSTGQHLTYVLTGAGNRMHPGVEMESTTHTPAEISSAQGSGPSTEHRAKSHETADTGWLAVESSSPQPIERGAVSGGSPTQPQAPDQTNEIPRELSHV